MPPNLLSTLGFGLASALLYFLLFAFSQPILELSRQGGWHFLIPITIALLFSYVHGQFTGRFWDLLGMKAKPNP